MKGGGGGGGGGKKEEKHTTTLNKFISKTHQASHY